MYIVLDLETTGFSPDTHEIIEFAAILIGGDYIPIAQLQTLIRPNIMPEPHIEKITGITQDRLTYAPTITETLHTIQNFIGYHTVIGHNIKKFDAPFLQKHGILQSNSMIDTLELSRNRGATEKHSLDFLCDYYNIQRKRKHRALDDVKATIQLYKVLN